MKKIHKLIAMIMCLSMLLALPVSAAEKKEYKVSFSKEVPEKLADAERSLYDALPEEIHRMLERNSTGINVSVMKDLPDSAKIRPAYKIDPIIQDAVMYFADDTAFLVMPSFDGVIAHHLDGFEGDAEKAWDEQYKPELARIYNMYYEEIREDAEEKGLYTALETFVRHHPLWLYYNAPNLSGLVIGKLNKN